MGRIFFYMLIALVGAYGVGFGAFLHSLPRDLPNTIPTTDAVTVFTGSTGRVAAGFEILRAGFDGPLFVSGVHPQAVLDDLTDSATLTEDQQSRVTLDYAATNTRDNVRSAAYWLAEAGHKSVTVVTAYYHLPRSILLWRQHAPEVKTISYPVFTGKASLLTLWREYNKLLAASLRLL